MTSEPVRRPDPEPDVLYMDLCDVWLDVGDHRCRNYWRVEVVLDKDTHVTAAHRDSSVWGNYHAGTWRFCNIHARIFERDRDDKKEHDGQT